MDGPLKLNMTPTLKWGFDSRPCLITDLAKGVTRRVMNKLDLVGQVFIHYESKY